MRGEQEHRDRGGARMFVQLGARREAVLLPRHEHVEHDHIGALGESYGERFLTAPGARDGVLIREREFVQVELMPVHLARADRQLVRRAGNAHVLTYGFVTGINSA